MGTLDGRSTCVETTKKLFSEHNDVDLFVFLKTVFRQKNTIYS